MRNVLAIIFLLAFPISPASAQTTYSDRFAGSVVATIGKQPVVAATTSNIGLFYSQVIDGVTVSDHTVDGTGQKPDRVLVKNQNDSTQNGIYVVSNTGAWYRAKDFSGPSGVVKGQIIMVNGGTQAGLWQVTSNDPISVGTDSITISAATLTGAFSVPTGTDTTLGVLKGGTGVTITGGSIGINYGTISGTAAQGNDSRITNALSSLNNLSDTASPNTALNNLLPSQVGNNGKALVTNGTNTSWMLITGTGTGGTTLPGGSSGQLQWNNANSFDGVTMGKDATFVASTGDLTLANTATARSDLGLGTMATQAASSVAITGGTLTGITATGTFHGNADTATSLSGTLGVSGGGTGNSSFAAHQALVATGSTTVAGKTLPNCLDTSGQHLNYNQSTDAFSCGTTTGTVTGGFTTCTTVSGTGTASCAGGYTMTGGGCEARLASGGTTLQGIQSYPSGANTWTCSVYNGSSDPSGTAYAICCQ